MPAPRRGAGVLAAHAHRCRLGRRLARVGATAAAEGGRRSRASHRGCELLSGGRFRRRNRCLLGLTEHRGGGDGCLQSGFAPAAPSLPAAAWPPLLGGPSGRHCSRRRRLARNAPGRSMRSGHDHPRARMSAFNASMIVRTGDVCGSMPAVVIASHTAPMWPRWRPCERATSSAARRCTASGRGVARQHRREWRFFVENSCSGAHPGALGEGFSTQGGELFPPDGGRWKSCTACAVRRGTKW